MSATLDLRLTPTEWATYSREPTRDKRYRELSQLGADLADYLSWGAVEAGKAPRTLDQYERDIARGLVLFPDLGRDQWTKTHMRTVLAEFPPGSRPRAHSAWSDFWRWMYDEERIDRNPMRGIRRPKPQPRKIPRIFNDGERASLVTAQTGSPLARVDVARQLFLHETGARAGECLAFRLEHADLARRYVILHGKGGKQRAVPIRGDLVQALTDLLTFPLPRIDRPLAPTDHLFFPSGRSGQSEVTWLRPEKPMVYSTFWRWWDRCVGRAGVSYRKPHMTRHTYATDLLDATEGDLYSVKEALGHSSTRVTEEYLHVSQQRLERAVEKLTRARDLTPDERRP